MRKAVNPHSCFAFCILHFAFIILLSSCFDSRNISNRNLADSYRNSEQFYHPEFAVRHTSPTSSILFIKLISPDFLYVRQPDDTFKAVFSIHYDLFNSYESTTVLDSSTFNYELLRNDTNSLRLYTIPFRLQGNEEYLLSVTIHDIQKKFEEQYYVKVDNKSKQSRQSFYVQPLHDSLPLFRNYLTDKDSIKISYRDSTVRKLWVHYYHRDFPLAPPPFNFDYHEDFNYTPDSIFEYTISPTSYIVMPAEGFYHFKVDTSDKEGLTLFRFNSSYPTVTRPEQMIESIRYLTTKKEFDALKSNPNAKAAIEKMWMDFADNSERARYLIKKYYTRVQEANRYFSSYMEGWRTDRGMCYVIFGKPSNVYKSSVSESWTYGTPGNALSLNFMFTKVNNPFTDNDFSLSRAPIYEGFWYRAVDAWRQGRVYNDN
jgi:GWxTD domain-containing protein